MDALLHDVGPNGNVAVDVEDDGRVVYLYLRGRDDTGLGVRPVWVRNRRPAPEGLDTQDMKKGRAPLMPAAFCRHPLGSPPLEKKRLRVTWLPEGNGVALYEGGEMLAAIPPWAERGKFYGYSAEAIGEGPLAWDLSGASELRKRFREADAYWRAWDADPNPWPRVQRDQMAAYARRFGTETKYFAIDGDVWPPKGLARYEASDVIVLTTIGVALRPQPAVESHLKDPVPHRRIELGVALRRDIPETLLDKMAKYVSGQAGLPWTRYTWLGQGHSVRCDELRTLGYSAVLLSRSDRTGQHVELPSCFGDPVNLLWMVPVSPDELSEVKARGSENVLSRIQYPRNGPV